MLASDDFPWRLQSCLSGPFWGLAPLEPPAPFSGEAFAGGTSRESHFCRDSDRES